MFSKKLCVFPCAVVTQQLGGAVFLRMVGNHQGIALAQYILVDERVPMLSVLIRVKELHETHERLALVGSSIPSFHW